MKVDVVKEGVDGSLAFELGSLIAINGSGVVVGDCVDELDHDPSLTLGDSIRSFHLFLVSLLSMAASWYVGTVWALR